jgi:hypothetical protein
MKFPLAVTIVLIIKTLTSAADWDCDERCPNYEECVNEGGARRILDGENKHHLATFLQKKKQVNPALRGPAKSEGNENSRKLQSGYFHLKMYHEESREYCWQGEWEDRKWCLDCKGSSCGEGEELEIRKCQEGKEDQQFVYEQVLGSGGGRIRPYSKQDLCLVQSDPQVRRRMITLQECDESSYDNHEIFFGFSFQQEFKIVPKELDDHCLTQEHYPRAGERIYAGECEETCKDATCLWETIYESGSNNGDDDDGGDEDAAIPIQDLGGEYCSEEQPCEQCQGDCDNDEECAGEMICCFRYNPDDPAPSCSGAENVGNDRDFCAPPEYRSGGVCE